MHSHAHQAEDTTSQEAEKRLRTKASLPLSGLKADPFAYISTQLFPDTDTVNMKRYNASKYIKSEDALYEVLHTKHPEIARANFEITVSGICGFA